MPISNGSLEDEDCSDITDWADWDGGTGVSYQLTYDGKSTFGFFTNNSAAQNGYAFRSKDSGSVDGLGNRIVVSLSLYLNTIGTLANMDYFYISLFRSDWRFRVAFASDGLFIEDNGTYYEVGTNIVQTGVWQNWTFDIDLDLAPGNGNPICDIYLNDILQASNVNCRRVGNHTDGESYLTLLGYTTDGRVAYLDYYKVGNGFSWMGKLNGVTNPAKIMGISIASISKVMGV